MAHADPATTANAGVPNLGCTSASFSKNTPSCAMAKYMRGDVSVRPFAALNIETRITAAMSLPAAGPKSAVMASAAMRSVCCARSGPMAAR